MRPPSASDSGLGRFGCLAPVEGGAGGGGSNGGGSGGNGGNGGGVGGVGSGAQDPARAPVEPGPVGADGKATSALVPLRLRISPRAARSGALTRYRLTVHAKRSGKWVVVRGARVRLAGIRAVTSKRGVATIRARIRRPGVHAANATAVAARPARASVRVKPGR